MSASSSARRFVPLIWLTASALCACAVPPAGDAPISGGKSEKRAVLPLAQAESGSYPSTYAPLPSGDVYITNATILDGAGNLFENASLLLKGGKVAAIGAQLSAPANAVVIDARGRWVTPGIIDVHSHLGNGALPLTPHDMKVWDVNETSDPNGAHVWAEHAVNPADPAFARALAGGVTTLQILPGSANLFGGRGVVVKNVPAVTMQALKFPGAPAALKMACGENPKHWYGGERRFPSTRMGVIAGFRDAFTKAREYQQKWDDYEKKGRKKEEAPPARDLKMDTLAAALRGDIRVHVHCYRADEMAVVLDLAQEFGFKVTAFHHAIEAYKVADLLAQRGVCAVVWSDWWGYKMEAFDTLRENAAFVDAAGGCAILHSDSPVVGQRLNIEAAKALAAGRRAGLDHLTRQRAIQWITLHPARALGLDAKIGSLEAGKNADVVVWSGDPFSVYSKADLVLIDGAVVFDRNDRARQPLMDFEVGQPSSPTYGAGERS